MIEENKCKFAILTYGCQMNNYDSERIAGILNSIGYEETKVLSDADLILLNTCSVRAKAEQKVFSKLGRLKLLKIKKPNTIIGICGCIAQLHGKNLIQKVPFVDLILGTHSIPKLPEILVDIKKNRKRVVCTQESHDEDFLNYDYETIKREDTVRAFVNIMKGCSNFCTYCIVPHTRGKERSRNSNDILGEISRLAELGYSEITLLGQNVNSYGKDLKSEIDFPKLLFKVNLVEKIKRIRFVTSHPKDMSLELINAIKENKKVCEHIHLPVQSGSDRILKLMNRGYSVSEYVDKIEKLREIVPESTFSTDIIVGFPGETENDFKKTKIIVENLRYDLIYLFKYSVRPETKASHFVDTVLKTDIDKRFDIIDSLQRDIMLGTNNNMENKVFEVLVEGTSKKNKNMLSGRTRSNKIVNFKGEYRLVGNLVNILITKAGLFSLNGQIVSIKNEVKKN